MIYAEEGKMILRLNNEKDKKSTALGCNFAWTVKGVSDLIPLSMLMILPTLSLWKNSNIPAVLHL